MRSVRVKAMQIETIRFVPHQILRCQKKPFDLS